MEVVSSVENSKSVDMVSEPVMEAGNLLRNIETQNRFESLSHMDVDPDRGRAKRVHSDSDSDPELDIPISNLKHTPGLRCEGRGMGRDKDMAVSGGKEGVS